VKNNLLTMDSHLKKIFARPHMKLVVRKVRLWMHGPEVSYTLRSFLHILTLSFMEDHLGFYSSLAAVDRTSDKGRRSYAATGYLRPNLSRPNLKVLTEALATRVLLDGNTATGVEFMHDGKKHSINASKEVILSGGTVNSPQILELSGIGDPEILKAAGVECLIENRRVGCNFQDHVLGGMLYDLKDGLKSLDSLHDFEYQKAMEKVYQETGEGVYGSPGMLMGFVSYASLVSKEVLDATIAAIRRDSLAETDFEKRQEETIISQLSDPKFANIQTFCRFHYIYSLAIADRIMLQVSVLS
jgi:hypothetical protein